LLLIGAKSLAVLAVHANLDYTIVGNLDAPNCPIADTAAAR